MANDPSNPLRKIFVYREATMLRFLDLYWDVFEDATEVPDKNDPYWVVTLRRPRRTEIVELKSNPDVSLAPTFVKKQDQQAQKQTQNQGQ